MSSEIARLIRFPFNFMQIEASVDKQILQFIVSVLELLSTNLQMTDMFIILGKKFDFFRNLKLYFSCRSVK